MTEGRVGPEPVRLFVGSSARNRVEERVFVHTLRQRVARPLVVTILDADAGCARSEDGRSPTLPLPVTHRVDGTTRFSLARFAIPGLCGFQGRAIYCDSDLLAMADVGELWDIDLGGAAVGAVHVRSALVGAAYVNDVMAGLKASDADHFLTSVMVMDCSRLAQWDLPRICSDIDGGRLEYIETMFLGGHFRTHYSTVVHPLAAEWNCLDTVTPPTKLIHFTGLQSQPWLYPHHPLARLWEARFLEALALSAVSAADLSLAYRQGGVCRRIYTVAGLPEPLRRLVSTAWRSTEIAALRVSSLFSRIRGGLQWLRAGARNVGARVVRRLLDSAERLALPVEATTFGDQLRAGQRVGRLLRVARWRLSPAASDGAREVIAFIYCNACERMLAPIIERIARTSGASGVRATAFLRKPLSNGADSRLLAAGCVLDRLGDSLWRACAQPGGKVVLFCLDHRHFSDWHAIGIKAADALRGRDVRTVCVQHGGTRRDAMASLASTASEFILVWGKAARDDLVSRLGVDPARIIITGNPLHDHLPSLERSDVQATLASRYPAFMQRLSAGRKSLIVLATTVQAEYVHYADEQDRYQRYLEHFYSSLDFSAQSLIVKLHPNDLMNNRNLYRELLPPEVDEGDALLIDGSPGSPDVYSLLRCADLVVTRCSTVAEEALLMNTPVIAFDLDSGGPSRDYSHLAGLGDYQTVYAEPQDALARAMRAALNRTRGKASRLADTHLQELLTLALDGRSTERAAAAVLERVCARSPQDAPADQALA